MIKFKNREEIADYIKSDYNICEVGVKDGEYFSLLMKNNPQFSVAIDLWDIYTFPSQNDLNYNIEEIRQFEINFREKFKYTKILKMSSTDAACLFDDNFFDLIYIDADHTYESVKNDLYCWYSKLKSGGIFAGHDYCEYYIESTKTKFGVIQALDEFVCEKKLQEHFQITTDGSPEDHWKSWIIIKP